MRVSLPEDKTWRLGSRRSELALWQTEHVRDLLVEAWPGLEVSIKTFSTKGDQILDTSLPELGGKGLFTAELETALRQGLIDAAVHSLKDLPVEPPAGLVVGAITRRENPVDVLISRTGYTLETLPRGAIVGTSSRRRAAQLRHLRPDIQTADIRGNVPTRIRKALDLQGPYDAIILAYAGLRRLGMMDVVSQNLPIDSFLPAPGQGALGIQCRDESASLSMLQPLNNSASQTVVEAERAFLSGLGGGCSLPIAAHADLDDGQLTLRGRVSSPDGERQIDLLSQGKPDHARQLGAALALEALELGSAELLEPLL
jgi:hydroxymethylbilane synthase